MGARPDGGVGREVKRALEERLVAAEIGERIAAALRWTEARPRAEDGAPEG